jgi:ribosomal protein S18 acetylase RimI-like enzyme
LSEKPNSRSRGGSTLYNDFRVQELRSFLARSKGIVASGFLPLQDREANALVLDELMADLAEPSTLSTCEYGADELEGMAVCVDSHWDTETVGHKFASLKYLAVADEVRSPNTLHNLIAEILLRAKDQGVECLVCKRPSSQPAAIHALERHGFLLMDTLVDFACDLESAAIENLPAPQRGAGLTTRPARPEDEPAVRALSEKAFSNFFGRYDVDPAMPPKTGGKVYRRWVQSAFDGWADMILLAEKDNVLVGYGLWRNPSQMETEHSVRMMHYSLAGVDPEHAGQGIYSALAYDGMRKVRPYARYIEGPVHVTNYAVHRALHRLGWKTAGARHTFHRWI